MARKEEHKIASRAIVSAIAIFLLLGMEIGVGRVGKTKGKESEGKTVTGTAENLPSGLERREWKSIVEAHEMAKYEMTRTEDGWQGWNPGQDWVTKFDGRGFLTQPANRAWQWGVELTGYGFGDHQQAVNGEQVVRNGDKKRIAFRRDRRLEEWYVNDQRGLEHGFILTERPEGAVEGAPLTFSLRTRGSLKGEMNANARSIAFRNADGGTVINYSGLRVWDARGVDLPARFTPLANDEFQILVEEESAVYPVTVDPIAQQAYLKASNAGAGDQFGYSVAISGETVVVGALA
ncbi:MAG: FG-GAP repeat protein, partial [Blastocatellia bacterium]